MMKTRLRQTYQHTVLATYMRHKCNTTAVYEKRIIFFNLINQKWLSPIITTLTKKNPIATGTIINT